MRLFWRIFAAFVVVAAIIALGAYAYNIGIAQGMAQNVTAQGGQTVTGPVPMYWPHFYGFGPGLGFLGCLVPFFLLFLIFGSLRMIFWHGPMGWRRHMHHGPWGWHEGGERPVPPFFDEWHKRAHEHPSEAPKDPPTQS